MNKTLKNDLAKSLGYTLFLAVFFVLIIWDYNSISQIISSTVYMIVLYFILFAVGRENTGSWLQKIVDYNVYKIGILSVILLLIYYSYLVINNQNPFKGLNGLLPFFILLFPFVFALKIQQGKKVDWLDFSMLFLFIVPVTLINLGANSNLPISGGGFDSVYRIIVLITGVYSFGVIRNIKDIGFYPEFNFKKIGTAIWVWITFYFFIYFVAFSVDFITYKGHDTVDKELIFNIIKKLFSTFLHVALFEELVFRGLLQNMLQKRINQTKNWRTFWKWGFISLVILSMITGYFMEGKMKWFPALITFLIFIVAYFIEKNKIEMVGTYIALAITSVIFGLVHFHSGSIIFVGLASIGGWAYGYTYIKTKNIFYAALVHTLVNSTAMMVGFELMK
ncbi:MAG: CPBP family intramembrane glutamic endopeptidase [Bacteroidota bacterium]